MLDIEALTCSKSKDKNYDSHEHLQTQHCNLFTIEPSVLDLQLYISLLIHIGAAIKHWRWYTYALSAQDDSPAIMTIQTFTFNILKDLDYLTDSLFKEM